jgi:hypothetical protein
MKGRALQLSLNRFEKSSLEAAIEDIAPENMPGIGPLREDQRLRW